MLFFVCEEKKIMVTFGYLAYGLREDKALAVANDYLDGARIRNLVISVKEMKKWTEQSREAFEEEYGGYLSIGKTEEIYKLGPFLFDETHNPESPYYSVTSDTAETFIEQMFNDSLYASQELITSPDYPNATVGQKVDFSALPDGVWRVYRIPYRIYFGNTKEHQLDKISRIKNDLLFLLSQGKLVE